MQVSHGELIVLLGQRGSAKFAFLNLVSGIDLPDCGKIIIDDIDIKMLSEEVKVIRSVGHLSSRFPSV